MSGQQILIAALLWVSAVCLATPGFTLVWAADGNQALKGIAAWVIVFALLAAASTFVWEWVL